MSRHVHLPPLLPLVGPKPLEKKEKARRKPGVLAEALGDGAAARPEMIDDAPPPAATPATHNPSPLGASGGLLSVLLEAQEEARPATAAASTPVEDGL